MQRGVALVVAFTSPNAAVALEPPHRDMVAFTLPRGFAIEDFPGEARSEQGAPMGARPSHLARRGS